MNRPRVWDDLPTGLAILAAYVLAGKLGLELAFAHPCTGEPVHCVEDPPPLVRQGLDRE